MGVASLVLGIQGKKVPGQEGISRGGLVCSIIGTVLCLFLFVACVACVACIGVAGAAGATL